MFDQDLKDGKEPALRKEKSFTEEGRAHARNREKEANTPGALWARSIIVKEISKAGKGHGKGPAPG